MTPKSINPLDLTIVTACRNREKNLSRVLQSWLELKPASILICDWGSELPLTFESLNIDQSLSDKIKIIRINPDIANTWILTWAFNEALAKVKTPYTLKLDCDHKLAQDFLKKNPLKKGMFSRGHWRHAEKGQEHINGVFFSCSDILKTVGYFDERITTYGWDDSDLYARLYDACTMSDTISSNTVYHIDQDEEDRTREQKTTRESLLAKDLNIPLTTFLIQRNQTLCGMLMPWNSDQFAWRHEIRAKFYNLDPEERALHEYATLKTFDYFYKERNLESFTKISAAEAYSRALYTSGEDSSCSPISIGITRFLKMYSNAVKERDFALQGVIRHLLLSKNIPDSTCASRESSLAKIDKMHSKKSISPKSCSKDKNFDINVNSPKIYIDAQHGLGNRLRAIASAASIAKSEGYELVIVWEPDEHCNCYFHDLFDYSGAVIDSSFSHLNPENIMSYNYIEIEGGEKNKPIICNSRQSIYIRSAFTLSHPSASWNSENHFLHSLVPVNHVKDLVESVPYPNDISVHIRMGELHDGEAPSYESNNSNWSIDDQQIINHWRNESNCDKFISKINTLLKHDQSLQIFLACDNQQGYTKLIEAFGSKINYLPRRYFDRSKEQIQYALADALLLSKSRLLLGSNWSSFTELSMRYSSQNLKAEIAGLDF